MNTKSNVTASTEREKKIFFPNLDAIRFICFFLVFMVHSFVTDRADIMSNPFHKFIKEDLFLSGGLGVNMFFVLSGFLITYLLIKEKELSGTINIKNFYIRRVLRIWPLYFFCVFFGFVLFPIFKSAFGEVPNETAHPIYYLFFASNFDLIKHGLADSSILNILWSVSIEEQFYLFWPLIVFFVSPKKLPLVVLLILLLSTLFRIYYFSNPAYEGHTFAAATDLAAGCLLACIAARKGKLSFQIAKIGKAGYISAHIICIILFFLYHKVEVPHFEFINRIFFALSFAFVLYLQCFSSITVFAAGKLKLLSKLGIYTYGLYCLHSIAILAVTKTLNKFLPGYNIYTMFLLEFPLTILLSVFMAKISFKYFESYFLKLKNKFAFIKTR